MTLLADSESAQVAIVTVCSILVIVDIFGNSLVCIVIARNQDMRIPINYLLVNLALADMMVALFLAPMHIFSHMFTHPEGVTGEVLCKLLTGGNFGWLGGVCSASMLVAIAIERYYAVNRPLVNKLTISKIKIIIPCCWIFACIMTLPVFLSKKYDNNLSTCIEVFPEAWMGKAYSMTWLLVFGVFPMLIMVVLYSTVVYQLWFKRQEHSKLSCQQKGVMRVRRRVTLMAVTVSAIFAVCWVADAILYVLSYYSSTNKPNDVTYAVGFIMILVNSAVNPFIYALVNERFREKVKAMICFKCRSSNKIHASSHAVGNELTTHITSHPNDITNV